MDAEDLKHFRGLILKKKGELLASLRDIESSSLNGTPQDLAGDSSVFGSHMADTASNTSDREIAFSLVSREGRYLHHLNEALERIKKGNFGKCRSCSEEIPRQRLEAVPHATQCIKCKNGEEKKQRGR